MLQVLRKHLKVNIQKLINGRAKVYIFTVMLKNPQVLPFLFFSLPTAIGNAYAVLSNANKRRQYDQCGDERTNPSRQGPENENFEPDISPEDLFNMFFGGGYPAS